MPTTIFGIDAAQITPINPDGTPGTAVAVMLAGFSFNTESDSSDYSANNTTIDTRRYNKRVTGSIEVGDAQPANVALLGDGAAVVTGTTPNTTITYSEPTAISDDKSTIAARSWGGDGSVVERAVLAVKITGGPGIDAGSGNFGGITADFTGNGNVDDMLWTFSKLNGTAAVLAFA